MMKDNDDTRGMTIREIVLEIRQDLKTHLEKGHSNTPTRAEVFGLLIVLSGVLAAVLH